MFNAKQIAKLQKSVGKKVDVDIKKREEENNKKEIEKRTKEKERFNKEVLPNLIFIRNTINEIQKQNPDRGACFCSWKSKIHAILNSDINKAVVIGDLNEDFVTSFDLIKSVDDKKFFMLKEVIHKEEREIREWLVSNYAFLRMSMHKITKEEAVPGEKFESMAMLGGLSQKFNEKFPTKSIADFINYYKEFDKFFIESISGKNDILSTAR